MFLLWPINRKFTVTDTLYCRTNQEQGRTNSTKVELGNWIKQNVGAIADGLKFTGAGKDTHAKVASWKIAGTPTDK